LLAVASEDVLGVRRAAGDEVAFDDQGGLEQLVAFGETPGRDWRNSLKRAAPLAQA
jgi:hypothetical protein